VEEDPCPVNDQARPEVKEDTADEGDGISVSVDGGDVDRVRASSKGRRNGRRAGPVSVDASVAHGLCIVFRQDLGNRDLHELRITDVTVPVAEGRFFGLDEEVEVLGTLCPRPATSHPSRMFSISRATMPCPFGGSSRMVRPR